MIMAWHDGNFHELVYAYYDASLSGPDRDWHQYFVITP